MKTFVLAIMATVAILYVSNADYEQQVQDAEIEKTLEYERKVEDLADSLGLEGQDRINFLYNSYE